MFLETLQYSQENTCAQFSFLIKLQAYKVTPLGDCFWINYLIIKHKVRVFPILSFVTKNDLHKQLSPACTNVIHMVPHTLHFFWLQLKMQYTFQTHFKPIQPCKQISRKVNGIMWAYSVLAHFWSPTQWLF